MDRRPDLRNPLKKLYGWKSIRIKFAVPLLFLLFVTIGLVGFFLMQGAINSSHYVLKELQQHTLNQISAQISQKLQAAMQLNQINYDSLQSGILKLDEPVERERHFVNHIRAYPDVAMTFIGLQDGSFYGARRIASGEIQVVRNNRDTGGASLYYRTAESGEGTELTDRFPDFDPRVRPWYIKAAEVGKPAFSSIYSHFTFHEPTVTATYPVYDQNRQLIGVFGVDYLMSWLGDMLDTLPLGDSGQVFVTDDTGLLIAASFDTPAYKTIDGVSQMIPAKEINSKLIQASLALPLGEEENNLSGFTIDGKKYYAAILNFSEYDTNWKVYLILAEDDFLGHMKNAVRQTAVILILSVILSLFFTFWIAGRVARPIVNLSNAARKLTQGVRIPVLDDGREDELGELNRSFNEMGLQLTNLVANLEEEVAARTQELKERNEELQYLSFSDGLTGLANRRKFDYAIKDIWNSALRTNSPVAVFMLDIDYFKAFNDAYGHQAGDDCLKTIGILLKNKVRRASDLAARYGGEEFVIVIQDAEPDKMAAFAEEIRKSIEGLNIDHATSYFHRVTVSIGYAHVIPTMEAAYTQLVELADYALYQAKERGRNLVVFSGAPLEKFGEITGSYEK